MSSNVLSRSVLVLNKQWTAINVISAKKAIRKLFRGECSYVDVYREDENARAGMVEYDVEEWKEVVAKAGQPTIRTRLGDLCVPVVIKVDSYKHIPKQRVRYSKKNVYIRDNHTCQYCFVKVDEDTRSVDHVVPRASGGKTNWTNIVTCCIKCNSRKADKTLEQAKLTLKTKPFEPEWNDDLISNHPGRDKDWDVIIGPVPKPRAKKKLAHA